MTTQSIAKNLQGGTISLPGDFDPSGLDIETLLSNKDDGISRYLDSYGKLYCTPMGPYETLKEVEELTGVYRKTLLRRFYSKTDNFSDWYIIDGTTEITPSEDCPQCDEIDDLIFPEACWLCNVSHKHGDEVTEQTVFTYLYSGVGYACNVGNWLNGMRPHKEEGVR